MYDNLIDPVNFIKNFKNEGQFVEWLEIGTMLDLQATLKAFERAEMYELCVIIQSVIEKRR